MRELFVCLFILRGRHGDGALFSLFFPFSFAQSLSADLVIVAQMCAICPSLKQKA